MDKISLIYIWFFRLLLIWLPDYPPIMRVRGLLYSVVMNRCGSNFQVAADVKIMGANRLTVGSDVYLASGVVILARDMITLESEVLIGINSVLVSGNHSYYEGKRSYRFGPSKIKPIYIGHGSWVASNVTVTAGTTVGKGVLIGPSSSTYGNYDDYSTYLSPRLVCKNRN